jgi:hypothetical protein
VKSAIRLIAMIRSIVGVSSGPSVHARRRWDSRACCRSLPRLVGSRGGGCAGRRRRPGNSRLVADPSAGTRPDVTPRSRPNAQAKPLAVFLAVDSSGSILSVNDVHNTRLVDARVLVKWMGRYIARRRDELQIAEFARLLEPRVDRPLGAPGGTGLLGTAPDGRYTYFGPIADWVSGRIKRYADVILIVTDAEVPDAGTILQRLRAVARSVVVIEIAHDKGGSVSTRGVQVINATTDRPQAVAAAARVLLHVTGQGVKSWSRSYRA